MNSFIQRQLLGKDKGKLKTAGRTLAEDGFFLRLDGRTGDLSCIRGRRRQIADLLAQKTSNYGEFAVEKMTPNWIKIAVELFSGNLPLYSQAFAR